MSENSNSNSVDDDDIVDLGAVLKKLWYGRWWIFASVAIFSVALWAMAVVVPPTYRASVLMVPASAERSSMSGALNSALGQLGSIASLAGISVGGGDLGTEEALAVLRSREFTTKFIADKQLLPVLFSSDWDANKNSWKNGAPTLLSAYKFFNRKIRAVSQDKKTGLVTLQIDWTDRLRAAEWANELVQRLNEEMRLRAVVQADASVGFLQKELAATSVLEVRDSINRLVEAQVKQRMLANVTREYAFRVVDKAVAPDANDPQSPNKVLLIVLGPMLGGFLGALFVLIRSGKKSE